MWIIWHRLGGRVARARGDDRVCWSDTMVWVRGTFGGPSQHYYNQVIPYYVSIYHHVQIEAKATSSCH